uniref:Uncharacterized protein n=1 Tax=Cannabis sativa TaxID=3483 RepID=A0A803PHD1_CANSA
MLLVFRELQRADFQLNPTMDTNPPFVARLLLQIKCQCSCCSGGLGHQRGDCSLSSSVTVWDARGRVAASKLRGKIIKTPLVVGNGSKGKKALSPMPIDGAQQSIGRARKAWLPKVVSRRDYPRGVGLVGAVFVVNSEHMFVGYSKEPLDSDEVERNIGTKTMICALSKLTSQSARLTTWKAKSQLLDIALPLKIDVLIEDEGSAMGVQDDVLTPVEEDGVPPPQEP